MPAPLECVILIGLPGSGKSTLYRQKFADSHVHISKDLWPNTTARDKRQQEAIAEAFVAGKSVVIDNTNPTIAERARILAIAREHGARVIGYFFDITTRAAVARNANRSGRGKVPNVAIFTTAKRLQRPTVSERFDELHRVEIAEDRSLKISPIEK